jgi:hypothetical protein
VSFIEPGRVNPCRKVYWSKKKTLQRVGRVEDASVRMVKFDVVKGILLLLVGCFANNVFIEIIIKVDPGCGPALTFCQFLFIVLTLLPSNVGKPRNIPLWFYGILTVMFFCVSYLNNLAFDYQISQPVHMVCI